MSAIEFVVRNSAGAVQRGFVGGETGSPIVLAQPGSDISLNLTRSAISSFQQDGDVLRITLTNGQVISIDDYFGPDGAPIAELFISSDGLLTQVELAPGANGAQFANYVGEDLFGKWSPDDDLYFVGGGEPQVATPYAPADDDVGMLAAGFPLLGGVGLPLLGLLGLGAATSVLGGGETRPEEPQIVLAITGGTKSVGHVVNEVDQVDGAEIRGTGTVGGTVVVTCNGHTQTATVTEEGTWTVTFPPGQVPEGTYETPVTAVITKGELTKTVPDVLKVDTEVEVTFNAAATGGEGIVNEAEQAEVVVLRGTVDAGASVTVLINGQSFAATVTGTTWTLGLSKGFLATGEYLQSATVTAVDEYGNSKTVPGTFEVDTLLNVTFNAAATGGNGVVNAVEQDGRVTLSGTVDTDAVRVSVLINGSTFAATVSGGSWSLQLPVGFLPEGETFSQSATVTAEDDAGNIRTVTGSFVIDTELDVTIAPTGAGNDLVVNDFEQMGVIRVQGTVDTDAQSVSITLNGSTFAATINGGAWFVDLPAGFLPGNDVERVLNITVNATDVNGNTASTEGTVELDTFVNTLNFTGPPIGDDGIINRVEAQQGITLGGKVEYDAGLGRVSTVDVELRDQSGHVIATRAATISGANWTVQFAAGEIPQGEYTASFKAIATDHAGNTREISQSFEVDTTPPDAPLIELYARSGTGDVVGFTVATGSDDITLDRVDGSGHVDQVNFRAMTSPFNPGQTLFDFAADPAPNGSHLVMTAEDAAGNSTSTLFVLEESLNNNVNVTSPGYDGFNIEAIDLKFAEDSVLTLTAADLESLCAHSNQLTIHGGIDDTVNVTGAVDTGTDETIGGRTYSVYSFGAHGGTLIIDDAVTVHV